ncbi:MAG: Pvc16 family protein [Deltaproteobacteria bacterium]
MVATSAISIAARALRARLAAALAIPVSDVTIGHPAGVSERLALADRQSLNLFVYRVEHAGYPSDGYATDPTYLRLHCLITAYGNDERTGNTTTVSAGENDLRLIGSVVATLHTQPTLVVTDAATSASAELQIVPTPMTIEVMNNLWSTQSGAAYRPSVAYELSLAPAPFESLVDRAPRVSDTDVEVFLHSDVAMAEARIRFVVDGTLQMTTSFSAADNVTSLAIAVAGVPNDTFEFRWETFEPTVGWTRVAQTVPHVVATDRLDPAASVSLALPTTTEDTSQLLLVAEKNGRRYSNLLLATIHEATA